MNRKRGFSLVEVVVAIAILVTITVLAFGLVGGTRNVMFQSERKFKAANEAENIVKLYNLDKRNGNDTLKDYFDYDSIDVINYEIILYEDADFVPVTSDSEAKYYKILVSLDGNEIIQKITFTNIKTDKSLYTYELRNS